MELPSPVLFVAFEKIDSQCRSLMHIIVTHSPCWLQVVVIFPVGCAYVKLAVTRCKRIQEIIVTITLIGVLSILDSPCKVRILCWRFREVCIDTIR